MNMLNKRFIAVNEDYPAEKWLDYYQHADAAYKHWFLKEGAVKRPGLAECGQALTEYMPELLAIWEHLLNLTNADESDARLLSLYCPTPYITGCSQAVWSRYSPVLVRNYDYSPDLCEGRIMKSKWHNSQVIGATDCLWGLLDGMNEHGLCVSLAFGGSHSVGEGFGIPLVLRYILEFCKNTQEAIAVLKRVPVNMAYNITLLDAYFDIATVELSPVNKTKVTHVPFAVNHQGDFELTNYAMFSRSYERKQALLDRLYDPVATIESFIDGFEYAPLFASDYQNNFGTLYTCVYNPQLKAMEFRWPYHLRMYQSFEVFVEQEVWIRY
ncbi:C45 family autoproteolytic acyltransferase/hydolase [Psychromonas aquimarina]|uniref:C45 family autoproteolytic acyltransferase/hydolase n=1 Tax=Psychromonas aquimarina TaxID=444919 RepID=UPI00040845C8|nr:C45 family peptidase [Psychromonas aquimarina]